MKPAPFDLHRPQTVEAALELLAQHGEDGALVLAGGQSLVPMMALRVAYPPHLVDINAIPGLDRVAVEGEALTIGPLVRHEHFRSLTAPAPLGPLLAQVAGHIAHYPIRNRGTFCGSLAHADPASEWCLVAAVLGATLVLASRDGRREVTPDAWFDGPMTTTRRPDELLLQVRLPLPAVGSRWGFHEVNRRAGDFALGMALAGFSLDGGRIVAPCVGLGAVEDHPRRIPEAEAVLAGQVPSADLFRRAGAAAAAAVEPMGDFATPADYRRDLAAVVTARALAQAAELSPELSAEHPAAPEPAP